MCKITIKSLLSGDNEVERQTDGHIEDINSADEQDVGSDASAKLDSDDSESYHLLGSTLRF